MPLNLLKQYNDLLDIIGMQETQQERSLKAIFDRDIYNNQNFLFRKRKVHPVPNEDGNIKMEELFYHLTTVTVDKKTRHREFEISRSERLHWIKHHIDESKKTICLYSQWTSLRV